jgi:hypothetical protein
MSYVQRHVVTVTTDGDGNGTGYTPVVTGRVSAIHYIKTDYANGTTVAVTAEATGESIWSENNVNASATRAPRHATHSTAGAASLYAAGGSAVNDKIAVANDRVKIVIASGGDTKTGTFHVVIE